MKKIYCLFTLPIILTSCIEINSTHPNESFTHWAGFTPSDSLEVLEGAYWQSAHWTKEYIVYLKLKPSKKWWNDFIQSNALSRTREKWQAPDDAPTWFTPNKQSIMYNSGEEFSFGSRYFRDSLTGECYIYEIQL